MCHSVVTVVELAGGPRPDGAGRRVGGPERALTLLHVLRHAESRAAPPGADGDSPVTELIQGQVSRTRHRTGRAHGR